jgi:hypothetical protein
MAKLLGTTNDKDTCDCCGRTDLKLTYAIRFDDAGDVRYYGSECASKALRFRANLLPRAAKAAAKREKLLASHAAWIANEEKNKLSGRKQINGLLA